MKKAIVCGIGGTLIGIFGGAYVGAALTARIIGSQIRKFGGEEKMKEFHTYMEMREEPD